MICKYEDYLKEPYILTLEQMQQIHNDLLADLDNDPEALELYEELIAAATKYAAMRAKWLQLPRQEKMDTDSLRTSHHDSVITHFNMLARYLRMQGKKAAWRDAERI